MTTNDPRRKPALTAALAVALALVVAPASAAGEPGRVDPSAFLALAGDEHLDVEVTIGPAMIRLMSAAVRESEPELFEALEGLAGLYTAVVDVADPDRRARGEALVRDTLARLENDGWERIARVRDEAADLNVVVHRRGEERLDGLLVLIVDKEDDTLVFVNLHGRIDLSQIQRIAESMDVPGLGAVGGTGSENDR